MVILFAVHTMILCW